MSMVEDTATLETVKQLLSRLPPAPRPPRQSRHRVFLTSFLLAHHPESLLQGAPASAERAALVRAAPRLVSAFGQLARASDTAAPGHAGPREMRTHMAAFLQAWRT